MRELPIPADTGEHDIPAAGNSADTAPAQDRGGDVEHGRDILADWRDIPCSDLDWFLVLHGRRASHALERQCREATGWIKEHRPAEAADRWHTMTLGQLADRGEVWWRQTGEGIGVVAIRCIKEMIDRAAAGYEVRKNRDNSNAYRPTPIDPPPDHLRRRP